jgi:hypothetical protein
MLRSITDGDHRNESQEVLIRVCGARPWNGDGRRPDYSVISDRLGYSLPTTRPAHNRRTSLEARTGFRLSEARQAFDPKATV